MTFWESAIARNATTGPRRLLNWSRRGRNESPRIEAEADSCPEQTNIYNIKPADHLHLWSSDHLWSHHAKICLLHLYAKFPRLGVLQRAAEMPAADFCGSKITGNKIDQFYGDHWIIAVVLIIFGKIRQSFAEKEIWYSHDTSHLLVAELLRSLHLLGPKGMLSIFCFVNPRIAVKWFQGFHGIPKISRLDMGD